MYYTASKLKEWLKRCVLSVSYLSEAFLGSWLYLFASRVSERMVFARRATSRGGNGWKLVGSATGHLPIGFSLIIILPSFSSTRSMALLPHPHLRFTTFRIRRRDSGHNRQSLRESVRFVRFGKFKVNSTPPLRGLTCWSLRIPGKAGSFQA